ncbi:DUF2515 family protein [Lottiidibacillus patelloidae]|uniref:DUF2515 family protein n=1 Tax=Lottiidibacillus patelloidae TaxID=2670334 RepID=UPI001E386A98|nr:DUF2515 family protein [Lottiidibacillus patelloidae]
MSKALTRQEVSLVEQIKEQTKQGNIDNISRTVFYKKFYERNREIRWAFLASMVSRNAGWNMTDLVTNSYREILNEEIRSLLFLTYERANWLIFSDAYPQLLIYEQSKKLGIPLFDLLTHFGVSKFMVKEWKRFWTKHHSDRLVISQIINEQHVIEGPVLNDPFYKKNVFQSLPYKLQDILHFSSVIFPTMSGKLYGFSVHQFTKVKERVKVGKYLYWLLFYSRESELFNQFSLHTEHTGSRNDYEKYREKHIRITPELRGTFPIISHHKSALPDWYISTYDVLPFYKKVFIPKKYELTKWLIKKNFELSLLATVQHKLTRGGN